MWCNLHKALEKLVAELTWSLKTKPAFSPTGRFLFNSIFYMQLSVIGMGLKLVMSLEMVHGNVQCLHLSFPVTICKAPNSLKLLQ